MTKQRHALLLSGSLGMGHDVMAQACAHSLETRGWTTEIFDALELLSGFGNWLGTQVFKGIFAIPGMYDAFHFNTLRQNNFIARYLDFQARQLGTPRLREFLAERQQPDLVVSVFATAASLVGHLKEELPGVKTMTFCTDANPYSWWAHPDTDLYLLTSEVAGVYTRRFHPSAQVQIVPPPVREQFYVAPPREDARKSLGIPLDEWCVLVMGGGWGLGAIVDSANALADTGLYVLAVAGNNEKLEKRLRATNHPHIIPFGFTTEIPTLMSACDLVLTTPGDTCSEARFLGRHILMLDVVPGHGRENLQHELELGGADVTNGDAPSVVRSTAQCLSGVDPNKPDPPRSREPWEQAFEQALQRVDLA